jgi:ADP-heptose:LPS heptosyltransferase
MLLVGRVATGFGLAAENLAAVRDLICRRTGLSRMAPGTLNLRLEQPYALQADAQISREEYGWESLALQRCTILGRRAVIVRPAGHDRGEGHGPAYLEIVAEPRLRESLGLHDGDAIVVATGEDAGWWAQAPLLEAAARVSAERISRTPQKLILRNFQSPGDVVMLTAAVRDLHRCYPGRFVTDVRTSAPALWERNPYLTPLDESDPEVEIIECEYPLIHRSNETPHHFLDGFVTFLNDRLGLQIAVTEFKGDIYISAQEKEWFSAVEAERGESSPYWLLTSGGKYDYTIKWWDARRYQEVVDHFHGRIEFVQVGERSHHHPPLRGVVDLRGQTTLRQLVRLMYHAQGALSPVSLLMHLAAAVETSPGMPKNRPCVVVAGGREPPHWSQYPHQQFIHTVGALRCCDRGGCWKSRTKPLGDGDQKDRPENLCIDVLDRLPRCMHMIRASDVIRRVEAYFEGGALNYLNDRLSSQTRRSRRKDDYGNRKTAGVTADFNAAGV